MDLSPATSSLLSTIEALSANRLTRSGDLGLLLELGAGPEGRPVLDDLSFHAKGASRTYGIMRRIGKDGEGYGKLEKEFSASLETATGLMKTLLADAPPDVDARFRSAYFSITPEGLDNLLALMYDLSWYKNWRIDARAGRKGGA